MKKIILIIALLSSSYLYSVSTIYFKDSYTLSGSYDSNISNIITYGFHLAKNGGSTKHYYTKTNYTFDITTTGNYNLYFYCTYSYISSTTYLNTPLGRIKICDNWSVTNTTRYLNYYHFIKDTTAPSISAVSSPSSWTTGNVNITATITDSSSGVKSGSNYYKVNSGPWISGTSVAVSSNCTVYFKSEDNVGNLNSSFSHSVTNIDHSGPAAPTISGNRSTWGTSSLTLSASSTSTGAPVSYYQYKIGDGSWTTGRSVSVSSNNTVYFKSFDVVGNVSSESSCVPLVDNTLPVFYNIDGNTSWGLEDITLTLNFKDYISGVEKLEYKVGDGNWTKDNFSGNVYTKSFETYEPVRFRITDFAGNMRYSDTIIPKVDNISPILPVIIGNAILPVNNNLSIECWSKDLGSGLDKILYKSDLEGEETWIEGTIIPGSFVEENGILYDKKIIVPRTQNCFLEFKAVDILGNETLVSTVNINKIDKEYPTIIIGSSNNLTYGDNVAYTNKRYVEDIGTIAIEDILESEWVNGEPTFLNNFYGNYAIQVSDTAGNITTKVFAIDTLPPTISSEFNYAIKVNTGVNVNFTATDDSDINNDTWWYKIGSETVSWTRVDGDNDSIDLTIPAINLDNGDNDLYVKVSDSYGNESSSTYYETVKFDNTPPVLDSIKLLDYGDDSVIESIVPGSLLNSFDWTNKNIKLLATSSDSDVASIKYRVNKRTYLDNSLNSKEFVETINYTYNSAPNFTMVGQLGKIYHYEKYNVDIIITDDAGNENIYENVIINIDRMKPVFISNGKFENRITNGRLVIKSRPTILDYGTLNSSFTPSVSDLLYLFDGSNWGSIKQDGDINYVDFSGTEGAHSLYFSYTDNSGNTADDGKLNFTYDITGPSLDQIGELSNSGFVKGNKIIIETKPTWNDTKANTLEYHLGSDETYSGDKWTPISDEIDINFETEGIYYIHYRIQDNIGNYGYSVIADEFIVDKSEPEVTELVAYALIDEDYISIEDKGYSPTGLIHIRASGTDTYGTNGTGNIGDYEFYSYSEKSGLFNLVSSVKNGNYYELTLLNGVNYIKAIATDYAGNKSDISFSIPVVIDTLEPTNLKISSTSHPEAKSEIDTVAYSTAYFDFAAKAGSSGINNYSYKLYKTFKSNYLSGLSVAIANGVTSDSLELIDLEDNIRDIDNNMFEYYFLEVVANSNNGKSGDKAYRQFRVDQTPPQQLTINSKTHQLSDKYYNQNIVDYSWKEPKDLTGIKQYYYKFVDMANPGDVEDYLEDIDLNNGEENSWDLSDWEPTTKKTLKQNLKEFVSTVDTGVVTTGNVTLLLVAEDWTGKKDADYHSVLFDLKKPTLSKLTGLESYIDIDPSINNGLIDMTFLWNLPVDAESGIKNQTISLFSIEENLYTQVYPLDGGKEELSNTSTAYTIKAISTEHKNFRLQLDVYDNAGNKKTINQFFNAAGLVDTSPQYPLPFDETFYGFRVKGQTIANTFADLYLPKALNLKRDDTYVTQVPLQFEDEFNEFIHGSYILNSGVDSPLEFSIGGFNFKSYGMTLGENGLEILTPELFLPGDSEMLFEDNLRISSPRSLSSDMPISAMYSGYNQLLASNNWVIESSEDLNFILEGEDLFIESGYLPIIPSNQRGFQIYRDDEPVLLSNILLNFEWDVLEGDFVSGSSNSFIIQNDSYKIKVNNAILRDSNIIIKDGEILVDTQEFTNVDSGLITNSINIKDVVVSYLGDISPGKEFSYDDVSYIYGSTTYNVDNLEFTGSGISLNGSFTVNDDEYYYNGHIFNNEGLDLDIGASIETSIELNYGGYTLSVSNVVLKGSELYINSAELTLPSNIGGATTLSNSVSALVLDSSNFSVKNNGIWNINNKVTSDYGFGNGLTLKSIELGSDGNFYTINFPETELSFDNNIITSNIIHLNNISLDSAGILGDSDIVSNHDMKLEGFSYIAENIKYAGSSKNIIVENIRLISENINEAHLNNIDFTGLTFNGHGIINYGSSEEQRVLNRDGWHYNISNIEQRVGGVYSTSTLDLPIEFGYRKIIFNDFKYIPGGLYESGKTSSKQFVNIGGWRVLAEDLSVNKNILTLKSGEVKLFSTMGSKILSITETTLSSDGKIINTDITSEDINFLSENGFNIEGNRYKLSENGILVSGKVLLPESLQTSDENVSLNYSDLDLLLNKYGEITTLKSTEFLDYSLGGFGLSGINADITKNGLYVEENSLQILGLNGHELGSIEYYASGEIKFGGEDFTPFSFAPLGDSIIFTVKSLKLTEDGINLKSFVTLPKEFAVEYIYFDKLTFHSDGTITSDAAVPHLEFTKFGTKFSFEDIYLDGDGFSIGEAVITLPESMESTEVELDNFRITKNGQFELGNAQVDPFDMWGYTFYIDHLGFGDLPINTVDGISFTGGVRLPGDFGVSELAGKRFTISELEVPYSGGDLRFNLSLDDTIDMRIFDKWDASITGIEVDQDFKLVINSGTIDLPNEFNTSGNGRAQLTIKNITIDPVNYSFDVKEVVASNLFYTYNDLDFSLESLSLSQDNGLVVTNGSVEIPVNDPNNPKFPPGLDGTTLTIKTLQIHNDFTVGDLNVIASKENSLPILNELIYLEPVPGTTSWKLALEKDGDNLYLGVSARARLGNSFPPGIKGKALNIGDEGDEYGIKVNVVTGEIKRFDISGDFRDPVTGEGFKFDLFGNTVETKSLGLSYVKESDVFELNISDTSITLDSTSVPPFIKNTICTVNTFTIDQTGHISEFSSTVELKEQRELFSGIYMENWKIGLDADEDNDLFVFSILDNGPNSNVIELGSTFPEGIAGTKSSISKFSIDSNGNIGELEFGVTLSPTLKLFGDLSVRGITNNNYDASKGASLDFVKSSDGQSFTVAITAAAKLPGTLPEGFADLEIPIHSFVFQTTGKIISLDMSVSGFNKDLYGGLSIENGTINVGYDSEGTDDLVFDFGGNIKMPPSVSSNLGVESLDINKLQISSKRGILNFDAGVSGEITTPLFAGMSFTFKDIAVSTDGVRLAGSLNLPNTLAEGLPDSILLNTFAMDWSGEIIDISAGISNATVKVGGFTSTITNFVVNKDNITMDTFRLSLPSQMGGQKVGFNNAGFNYNGEFFGECVLGKIESPDIAGFKIILVEPSLDVQNKQIAFKQVYCKTPDFVGGVEIGINGVKVSPTSLSISGGEISLPDFEVGEGMGFKDIKVAFTIDGSYYYVKGGGQLMVPGMGTFVAKVSFTNPSSVYPIGLEQAYFSWQASGPGIPMASTGMFLNGIRGGLTFGPPIEIPATLRPMFDNGTRIQLGLTIVDSTGGSQVRGDADIWLDITDWDWAFKGDLVVLDGIAKAEVLAAITGKGFYGKLSVTLAVVRGTVQIYIFDEYGKTIISGDASVEFGLQKGAIYNKKILWKRVRIPGSDMWLAKGTAQFGRFKKGSGFANGVKGSIKIAWFNLSGFVNSNGQLDLKGANKYKLYTPFSERSRTLSEENSRVVSFDNRGQSSGTDDYNFSVPGGNNKLTRSGGDTNESEVESIVFMVIYPEGDPVLTAISEDGTEYTQFDENVIIDRTEWGMYFIVNNPKSGNWSLKVDNMPAINSYEVEVFGNQKQPEMTLGSFGYSNRYIDDVITINGTVTGGIINQTVKAFARENKDSFTGYKLYETTTDLNGEFEIEIDPEMLTDGENFIYVSALNDDGIDIMDFIDGSIVVNNFDSLLPEVDNLLLSNNKDGDLVVNFDKLSSVRVAGYNLTLVNKESKISNDFYLGQMNNFVIPGLEEGTYEATVTAKDSNGIKGASTPIIEYNTSETAKDYNKISSNIENILLNTYVGESTESLIDITVSSPVETDSPYDFVVVEVLKKDSIIDNSEALSEDEFILDDNWGIYPIIEKNKLNISSGTTEIHLTLATNSYTVPGTYDYELAVRNMGNLNDEIIIPVRLVVDYPPIVADSVSPTIWEQNKTTEFEIFGEGFVDGTKLFIDGKEIPTTTKSFGSIKALIPLDIKQGLRTVSVISPSGETGEVEIDVIGPSWSILSYKGYTGVNPGSTTSLFFTIIGSDGFTGSVPFSVNNLPEEWTTNWLTKSVMNEEINSLDVNVPENTPIGTYYFNITDIEDNSIAVEVFVTNDTLNPTLSSLSSFSVLAGEELELYGFGFTSESQVLIGENSQEILSRSSDKLVIRVSDSEISGDINVINGELLSNSIALHIKERGYKIYPKDDFYRLQPGESVVVPVNISGYSESVSLELLNQSEDITAYLDDTFLELNGFTNLNITVNSNIANGTYPVTIKGTDGEIDVDQVITIQIGDAYNFKTENIPTFMEGVSSTFKVETINGDGESEFRLLESDYLPSGLSILKDGTISGKVLYGQSSKKVTIIAEDSSGREINREFEIVIEENSWPLSGKDGGNSRFNPTPSPAEKRTKWTQGTNIQGTELLVGKNRVFVKGDVGINVLAATSGMPIYTVDGQFKEYFYSSDTLFTLDEKGMFTAWEVSLGNKKWSRENIIRYSTNGFNLLLEDPEGILEINLTDGQLINEYENSIDNSSIWFNNLLHKTDDNKLYNFNNGAWIEVFESSSTITKVVADSETLILLTESSQLTSLDEEYNINISKQILLTDGEVVLTDKNILILSDGYTYIFDKTSIEEKYKTESIPGNIVSASEKFFIVGDRGLEAKNIYNGKNIWTLDTPQLDLTIVGEELFGLDQYGKVTCYNGRNNVFAPTSVINSSPVEANGNNGYYTVTPSVGLDITDPETYVAESFYKYDQMDFETYTTNMDLPDGKYSFAGYGIDSNELRGLTDTRYFKIDTVNPETIIVKTLVEGDRGYTISDVTYNLSATDETSGIEHIYYELNGDTHVYSRPVTITEEGDYNFKWWSEDRAGNLEPQEEFSVSVDLNNPEIWLEEFQDEESGTIYLYASDTFSGVNRIEYRINGDEIINYHDPINLPAGELYNVTYRAVDNSERVSGWNNIVMDLTDVEPIALIQNLRTSWRQYDISINDNVQVSDPLFDARRWYGRWRRNSDNTIKYLPEYLVGGEMIVSELNDKYAWNWDFYQFTTGLTTDIYIVKNKYSHLDLDNTWIKVDKDVDIAPNYFKGGADIYYKKFEKNEDVIIAGSAMWQEGAPNLIIAKRNLEADLNIFSPNPSKDLYPLSTNWFAAANINGQLNRHWYYKLDGEDEVDLGETFSGEFTLPYIHEDTTLELIVEVEAVNPVDETQTDIIRSSKFYNVLNRGEVVLIEPVSGSQVLLDNPITLDYKVYGIDGTETDKPVTWSTETDSIIGKMFNPTTIGLTDLKSEFNIYEDWIKEGSTTLNIVETYQIETFDFGTNLIEEYEVHEDGRVYGFSKDYRHRVGETTFIDIPKGKYWSNKKITKEYIAFDKDDTFNYLVNNGLYRVKALVGPLGRYDKGNITIEGNKVDLQLDRQKSYYIIEQTVDVTDNNLTISGSTNLQLLDMEVQRVEIPIEATITRIENRRVIGDMKWYLWNPDHYFPELDWFNRDNRYGRDNSKGRR